MCWLFIFAGCAFAIVGCWVEEVIVFCWLFVEGNGVHMLVALMRAGLSAGVLLSFLCGATICSGFFFLLGGTCTVWEVLAFLFVADCGGGPRFSGTTNICKECK